jgi:hypothetical protein
MQTLPVVCFYHSPSGYTPDRSTTISDVIAYETSELGNQLRICAANLELVKHLSARTCLWVYPNCEPAERRLLDAQQGAAALFGDDEDDDDDEGTSVETYTFPDGYLVLAQDFEGGLLVWSSTIR